MPVESALHRAIIQNDISQIELLSKDPLSLLETEALGFTSLELIHYLDRPFEEEKSFKILPEGASEIAYFDRSEFESFFHLHYLSRLKFSSYPFMKKVIKNCPYLLRNKVTAESNLELGAFYRSFLAAGYIADISIRWIDPSYGYGLFAETPLTKGTYIGEYTGLVRQLHRLKPDHNAYCFHYPTRLWSLKYLIIDALTEGNELRFANHSDDPSMEPACLVDRGLLHLVFFAKKEVRAGEQLTFDYGQDYWKKRKKYHEPSNSCRN